MMEINIYFGNSVSKMFKNNIIHILYKKIFIYNSTKCKSFKLIESTDEMGSNQINIYQIYKKTSIGRITGFKKYPNNYLIIDVNQYNTLDTKSTDIPLSNHNDPQECMAIMEQILEHYFDGILRPKNIPDYVLNNIIREYFDNNNVKYTINNQVFESIDKFKLSEFIIWLTEEYTMHSPELFDMMNPILKPFR